MKPFKFLRCPIATSCDGGYIYAGETFFTMNKEEYPSVRPGKVVEKYTIVRRYVAKKYVTTFKPDYNTLLYFRTMESAEFHRSRLIHWDEHINRNLE